MADDGGTLLLNAGSGEARLDADTPRPCARSPTRSARPRRRCASARSGRARRRARCTRTATRSARRTRSTRSTASHTRSSCSGSFGSGNVDFGFAESGADEANADIIRAYHAILPEGQLAGTKTELMPVLSGVNQEAVEQRLILQSLAKQKNTLYLGGLTELPDDLRIDPREALLSGSNVPADLVQTAGELASALDTLGYNNDGGENPWGPRLPSSRMLAPPDVTVPENLYAPTAEGSGEPLLFDSEPSVLAYNGTGTS